MSFKNRSFLLALAVVLGIVFMVVALVDSKYDENHTFSQVDLNGIDAKASLSFPDYIEVKMILSHRDSINPFGIENQKILASILTDSLQKRIIHHFDSFNPDTLNALLFWAGRMKAYSEIDKNTEMFFDVVSSHWINFVSNNLRQISDDTPSVIYKFKYKYLQSQCMQAGNNGGLKISSLEKVINNCIEKKWSYLWKRFSEGTSWLYKGVVFLFGSLLLFSFYCTILFIRKKI